MKHIRLLLIAAIIMARTVSAAAQGDCNAFYYEVYYSGLQVTAMFEKGEPFGTYTFRWYNSSTASTPFRTLSVDDQGLSYVMDTYTGVVGGSYYVTVTNPAGCTTVRKGVTIESTTPPPVTISYKVWKCNSSEFNIKITPATGQLSKNSVVQSDPNGDGIYTFPISQISSTFLGRAMPIHSWTTLNVSNPSTFTLPSLNVQYTPFCSTPAPAQIYLWVNNTTESNWAVSKLNWYSFQNTYLTTNNDIAISTTLPYDANGYRTELYVRLTTGEECTTPRETVPVSGVPTLTSAGNINVPGQWICPGTQPAQITATTPVGGLDYRYQWQESTDNSSWSNITGAHSAAYTPPTQIGLPTALKYFRRVVTTCGIPGVSMATNSYFVDTQDPSMNLDVSQQGCPTSNNTITIAALFSKRGGMSAGDYTFRWFDEIGDVTPIKVDVLSDDVSELISTITGPAGEDFFVSVQTPQGCGTSRKGVNLYAGDVTPSGTYSVWRCNDENDFHIQLTSGTSWTLRKNGVEQTGTNGLYSFPMSDRFSEFVAWASNGICTSPPRILNVPNPIKNIELPAPTVLDPLPFCANPLPQHLDLYAGTSSTEYWVYAGVKWYTYNGAYITTNDDMALTQRLDFNAAGYQAELVMRSNLGEGCISPRAYFIPVASYTAPPAPADKNLVHCNFDNITLDPGVPYDQVKWFDASNQVLGTERNLHLGKLFAPGSYTYKAISVSEYGCESTTKGTFNIQVTDECDDQLNWTETEIMDEEGTTYSHSKNYFDLAGNALQTQTKLLSAEGTTRVFASQPLKDKFNRVVGSTLSAPIPFTGFNYHHGFILNPSLRPYEYENFDDASTDADPVNNAVSGTVGWYYSANNTMETHVPKTAYPYSRMEFYQDGSGEVRRSVSAGDVHRMGAGHELITGTFPVYQELDDYVAQRSTDAGLPDNLAVNTLKAKGVISIVRDENGKYTIGISDKSGKGLLSARAGTADGHVLAVLNQIVSSTAPSSTNYRPITYFYILEPGVVTVTGSTDFVVEDILNDVAKPVGQTFADPANSNKWPAGFYRIILDNDPAEVTITYTNYYTDVSCQFYDDAGRLRYSVSPNGYKQWRQGVSFQMIDKTEYRYNHRGWLLSMTEPDAGTTHYVYRKDGKIRFSQNSEQRSYGRFSYTHYDKAGRPVESGEYRGTELAFVNMDSPGFSASAMKSQLEQTIDLVTWTGPRVDWVKTHYDFPVSSITGVPPGTRQEFVRGAVSWTQNENITTWYSYDELGRMIWMAQLPTGLSLGRTFMVKYSYDFLGNVTETQSGYCTSTNFVSTYFHHYEYDLSKRLSKVYTSTDGTHRALRATYHYYLHGPLKRIELGDKLQGIDFVYNINGWLTQINHPETLNDPGQDGTGNGFHKDFFGMKLDYYDSEVTNLIQSSTNDMKPSHRYYADFRNLQGENVQLVQMNQRLMELANALHQKNTKAAINNETHK